MRKQRKGAPNAPFSVCFDSVFILSLIMSIHKQKVGFLFLDMIMLYPMGVVIISIFLLLYNNNSFTGEIARIITSLLFTLTPMAISAVFSLYFLLVHQRKVSGSLYYKYHFLYLFVIFVSIFILFFLMKFSFLKFYPPSAMVAGVIVNRYIEFFLNTGE